ncbi:MAG: adenylate kinase [Acidobacteriota bacterium]
MRSDSIVVLVGPPGAGKGTQGEKLTERFNLVSMSTGQVLREEARQGSDLGRQAQSIIETGGLVPDSLVAEIVRQRIDLADSAQAVLLDGFPRNLAQADLLEGLKGERSVLVVNIHVDEDVVLKRLRGRRYCQDCGRIYNFHLRKPQVEDVCDACGAQLVQREDDREEVIETRLRVYREETRPLIEAYSQTPAFFTVNGNQKPQAVFEEISTKLDEVEVGNTAVKSEQQSV